jgi:hypothetical protein
VVAKQALTMHPLHIGLCKYEKVRHCGAAGVSVPCAQGGVAAAQPPANFDSPASIA